MITIVNASQLINSALNVILDKFSIHEYVYTCPPIISLSVSQY